MSGLSDSALAHLREVLREVPGEFAFTSARGARYEVLEEVGRGGMGVVHRAHDPELARDVALKVLAPGVAGAAMAARLVREAKILARLEHPGIVPVHEVGALADGRVYAAMKLVRGQPLAVFLASAPPAAGERARQRQLAERLRLFLKILEAVGFAHARGVVHCDLKPANVMVGAFGEVLVMDWGLARIVGAAEALPAVSDPAPTGGADATVSGAVLGTPGYMAPEQERGERAAIDARTDVFALGAILGGLAGGADGVPPLLSIARRAQAALPDQRYPDAAAMAVDVERFLAGQPVAAHRERVGEALRRWYARYEAPFLLVVAYLLLRFLFAVWPR
jgi:eukaryotic-like serine/threonine-protein kinase